MPYTCPIKRRNASRIRAARWASAYPEKRREAAARYRLAHPERVKQSAEKLRGQKNEGAKRHYAANRTRLRLQKNKYYQQNRKAIFARVFKRLKSNPEVKIAQRLRTRLYNALKGKTKSDSTVTLLGCTPFQLVARLTVLFSPGMTWENYGPVWHIDHIRPCARFDLTDPAQQRECFHYMNLQPLFKEDNLKKGDKWD